MNNKYLILAIALIASACSDGDDGAGGTHTDPVITYSTFCDICGAMETCGDEDAPKCFDTCDAIEIESACGTALRGASCDIATMPAACDTCELLSDECQGDSLLSCTGDGMVLRLNCVGVCESRGGTFVRCANQGAGDKCLCDGLD